MTDEIRDGLVGLANLGGEIEVSPDVWEEDGRGDKPARLIYDEVRRDGARVRAQAEWVLERVKEAKTEDLATALARAAETYDSRGETRQANVLRDAADLIRGIEE